MLDSPTLDRFAELARARFAAGATHDIVLGELRRDGLEKIDCIRVVHAATGTSLGDAKLLVHRSPVRADRREGDEAVEDAFSRAAFILCVVGTGQITEPEEWAVDCREPQQRASAQMHEIATQLPEAASADCHRCITEDQFGAAFAALVLAGRRHPVPHHYWQALAAVSDTLCLNEILDDEEPAADDGDYLYAAHVVRRLTSARD